MSSHPTSPPDHELIASASRGDRGSFEIFLGRHGPAVLRLARAMAPDEATAEDVVQEAFLSAYRSAGTFRPEVASARTWLFAIARNEARRARRTTREKGASLPLEEESLLELGKEAGWGGDLPEQLFEHAEEVDRLARAFTSLRAEDREILILRDLEGLAGEAASELLGIGLPAMKSRLHRARLRLLAALREDHGGVVAHQREVGGLTCGAVLERLGDYVDGDVPAAESRRIEAHLRGCSVCERFGGRYGRVVQGVRERLGAAPAVDEVQMVRLRRLLAEL